ncbi:C-reactive protein isoform X2 [Chionomys nivalis]|uniref:C-reactive protein isoform X2 n=1 Tax=Chionomys nivalis TaxID=269649 RepID=UPI00259587B3|nr:C-reactive protein isoform X2 [Chionomys nivalis]
MERLLCYSLILISFWQAFAQKDMSKTAFVFPKESASSYVSLDAQSKKPLTAFTVCLHIYTDLHTTQQINTVYVGGTLSPNVLNWQTLKYAVQGDVFIRSQLWP